MDGHASSNRCFLPVGLSRCASGKDFALSAIAPESTACMDFGTSTRKTAIASSPAGQRRPLVGRSRKNSVRSKKPKWLAISKEMGHGREQITAVYLGS